jgi:hypothetical protein
MTQTKLFELDTEMSRDEGFKQSIRYPDHPGSKTSGASEDAANKIADTARLLRGKALSVLMSRPCTADEVAAELGVSVLSCRPRISELLKQGKIEDTGIRRRNESGQTATVWRAR